MSNIIKSRRIFSSNSSQSDSLYTTDGTLTGDRIVTLNGYDLTFTGGDVIITGTGSTSATESLSVFNASGIKSLRVSDDGSVYNQGNNDLTLNTAFGKQALTDNVSGTGNSVFGWRSGFSVTSGAENSAFGYAAMQTVSTGASNTIFGSTAYNGGNGSFNTAIGKRALYNSASGDYNTAIGAYALNDNTAGGSNTSLGYYSGRSNTGSGSVFLGYSAGYYETASNKLFIDNATRASEADGRTKALVYGVFDAAVANQILTVNGVVSIGGPPTNSQVAFEIISTTKAFRLPNMTATERNAITATIDGLMIFNTTAGLVNYTSSGGTWRTFCEATAVQTFTNKRITPRNTATTQSATPTINSDNSDVCTITGLAQAITSMTTNLSGTPTEGQMLTINITDNGTARAITWGAKFVGTLLPTTTVINKALHVQLGYNSTAAVWYCISSTQEP
jgi:hypothetical protein